MKVNQITIAFWVPSCQNLHFKSLIQLFPHFFPHKRLTKLYIYIKKTNFNRREEHQWSPNSPAFIPSSHPQSGHGPHFLRPPGHHRPRNGPKLAHEVHPDVPFTDHKARHRSHLQRPACDRIDLGFGVEYREHGHCEGCGVGGIDGCGIYDGVQGEKVECPSLDEGSYCV